MTISSRNEIRVFACLGEKTSKKLDCYSDNFHIERGLSCPFLGTFESWDWLREVRVRMLHTAQDHIVSLCN